MKNDSRPDKFIILLIVFLLPVDDESWIVRHFAFYNIFNITWAANFNLACL